MTNDKILNDCLKHKSPDLDKLLHYGFTLRNEYYVFATRILDGQFEMRVSVKISDGSVATALTDINTGEPYALHLVSDAVGSFVGAVRNEYERVLREISDACFYKDVFKSEQAREIIKYVKKTYGDDLQFLWNKFPDNAIWRRKDNDKWYGILLTVSKRKLGLDSDEMTEIIDLRIEPDVLDKLADGSRYFRGYHMNKKSWITMILDGSVSFSEITERLDASYIIAENR